MNPKSLMHRGTAFAKAHKVISGIIVLLLVAGSWWAYGRATTTSAETRYVLGTAATSTIISTVSGSGQVSTSDSIDIKPKASGEILWIGVAAGDKVKVGQALMTIDNTTALQTLAAAKKTYAADQLQYQKDTAQAPINYQNDQSALVTAKENLVDDYNTTFNDLSNTYLDLPGTMSTAQDTLYGYDLDSKKAQWNMDFLTNIFTSNQDTTNVTAFKDSAKSDYATAKSDYDAAVAVYKQTNRTASNDTIDALLSQSTDLMTAAAQALQSELNFLGAVSDAAQTYNISLPSGFSTIQTNTRSALSSANSDLSTLLAEKKTLDTAKQSIVSAQQTITLDQVGNTDGTNPISLQISENNLQKEQQDIANQESDLANYTVVAPFDGAISVVDVKKGDTAGSGAVATIISSSQIAQLSLNEVDVAKIALGNKATLTFDAIDGLTLTGSVVEIDSVGTVSQGVVSYGVKIGFDTQDPRVKPGMTVNADVQTQVDQDVLAVPSTAVKTLNGQSFVQEFNPPLSDTGGSAGVASSIPPVMVPVTTGISDDTNVEILSGISAGDQIVVSTRSGTTAASTAARTTTTGAAAGAARGGNAGFGGGGAVLRGL